MPRRQLKSLLGFATNTGSNVVSVFNKFTMEVVDTIATSSGPMGAVLDQRREWAYFALAGDAAIEAIEVGTGEILRRLRLHFGDEPVEIDLTSDGEFLVSANRGSNSASIIDAASLREIERVRLPSEADFGRVESGRATGLPDPTAVQHDFRHRPASAGGRAVAGCSKRRRFEAPSVRMAAACTSSPGIPRISWSSTRGI